MITIITCSIRPNQLEDFKKNIEETIGVPYEIIAFDNREAQYGLCKVYNMCAKQAKYDVLCFSHEDIKFNTPNWGTEICNFMSSYSNVGVVGFAGSTTKTRNHSGWGSSGFYHRVNYVQHFKDMDKVTLKQNPTNEKYSHVAIIDGLCLFMKKSVWEEFNFDEVNFDKFHLYDLDICMQVSQKYKNYVCHTIEPEHFSTGSYDKMWYHYTDVFHNKWYDKLPYTVGFQSEERRFSNDRYMSKLFIRRILKDKIVDRDYIKRRLKAHYKQYPCHKLSLLLKFWLQYR